MLTFNFNNPHKRIYTKKHEHPGKQRAMEIQYLLDKGYTQTEIAEQLGLKRKNISDYIQRWSLRKPISRKS